MSVHAMNLKAYPQTSSPEYIHNTEMREGTPHVVLSTKYADEWFGVSVQVKAALIEMGFTVYNPNTDNFRICGDDSKEANSSWLRRFLAQIGDAFKSKGFVLQIQEGAEGIKSHMQWAEEELAQLKSVPRIGVWCYPGYASGLDDHFKNVTLCRAKDLAAKQWNDNKISPDLQMASETYEKVDGHHGDVATRNGYLRVTFPDGSTYEGELQNGKRQGNGVFTYADGGCYVGEFKEGVKHGHGKCTYPDGACYDGEWNADKKHGHGKYTFPSGNVYEGSWENGEEHGTGKKTYADGRVAHDGEWRDGKPV